MRPAPVGCAVRVLCLTAVLLLSACQPSAGLSFVGQLVVRVEPSGQAQAVLTLRDRAIRHCQLVDHPFSAVT